jgi:hypothetical protein
MKQLLQTLCLLMLLGGFANAQVTHPTNEVFGKNRLQYRRFDWKILTSQNFEVYFYQDAQALATLTAQYAESEFDRITDILGYTPYSRTKIFVYSSGQDLGQSNVGGSNASRRETQAENLAKSRIEIAFTGNQQSYKKALVRDITEVYVNDMLFGGNLKDVIQSSLLLNVPEWYISGITAYISDGWSVEMDDHLRDMILTKRMKRPEQTYGKDATVLGQSIWNYIAERYGQDKISNILNLTRIIRNEQTSISSSVGMPYARFLKEWRDTYATMAEEVSRTYKKPEYQLKVKEIAQNKDVLLQATRLSPDRQWVAIASNEMGKAQVELINLNNKKSTIIFNNGSKGSGIEPNNPLVRWTRDQKLIIVYNDGEKNWANVIGEISAKNPSGKTQLHKRLGDLEQVNSFDVAASGLSLAISGQRKGQNDLYLFELNRGTLTQITNDLYDDIYPRFVGRSFDMIFASNRSKDTLSSDKATFKGLSDNFKLFKHDGRIGTKVLTRLADSLGTIKDLAVGENEVFFLSGQRGISNIFKVVLKDSTVSNDIKQITNFRTNIEDYDLLLPAGSLVFKTSENTNSYIGYQPKISTEGTELQAVSPRTLRVGEAITNRLIPNPIPETDKKTPETPKIETPSIQLREGELDTDNYEFDSENLVRPSERPTERKGTTRAEKAIVKAKRSDFKLKSPTNYQNPLVIKDSDLDFQVDPVRGFGIKYQIDMNDLLENHKVSAGIFVTPSNFKNSDIFAEYTYLPNRIDFGIRFDRKSFSVDNEVDVKKKNLFHQVMLSAAYPFSQHARLKVAAGYTDTQFYNLELAAIADPSQVTSYAHFNSEFVFDNTFAEGRDRLVGTRFKLRFDHYESLKSDNQSWSRASIDARKYLKLTRDLILATRASIAYSFGQNPQKSVLGGTDNWISGSRIQERNPSNPTDNPFDFENNLNNTNIFFLDFATPLRGFRMNKLAGSSHMLFNAELRYPLVRLFSKEPLKDDFFGNLQVVTFADLGAVWNGVDGPFSRKNSFNTEVIGGRTATGVSPFRAEVTNFKSPFLFGYGFGARSTIAGFRIKFDYAWGLEDRESAKPIVYISLGHDF